MTRETTAKTERRDPAKRLTDRELFLAQLVADGLKNGDIAVILDRTEHMVKNYLRIIYDKLGLWNRTELALWYVRHVEFREKPEATNADRHR